MSEYTGQYVRAKMLAALLFGCANGIPLGLIGSALNSWLAVAGISKTTIGLFALVGLPYVFKFLWSPLIDNLAIPVLSKKLGRRKSWLLLIQVLLAYSIIKLGSSNPLVNTYGFAFWAFVVSIFAATQETIIDAYRVEMLERSQQGFGATSAALGHSMGLALAGGGTLLIVDSLCKNFLICEDFINWKMGYIIFGLSIFIASIASFIVGEPNLDHKRLTICTNNRIEYIKTIISTCIVKPFADFTKHQNWLAILIFITIYRTCDAFIGSMLNPFYIDIGFSLTEIALMVKTFGFFATTFGSIIGGILTYRIGVTRSLMICGLAQMLSNIMFIIQARAGNDLVLLYFSVAAENIGGAMATSVFIAYIANLCSSSQYTATQYSLLTALSSINYFFAASSSGWVAEHFGWVTLFGTSVVLGIPPLIILAFLSRSNES